MTSILLADPQDLTFMGLKHLLADEPAYILGSRATDRDTLLQALSSEEPDILILDYAGLAEFSETDCQQLINTYPNVKIIMLTADRDQNRILGMIQSGVHAFLSKCCSSKEILYALQLVKENQKFFCNAAMELITGNIKDQLEKTTSLSNFSFREFQIIELIAQDLSTQEIAEQLMLSPHTIHAHRKKILKKLGVCSPVGLLIQSLRLGILEVADGRVILDKAHVLSNKQT
ncbi:MAG: LuxR C-terminal-related transcriptional regulator [Cyclobacteriaceae bacterium]